MILISHRGNLNGPDRTRENTSKYIEEALAAGFDVEVDVWYQDEKFFLGHDGPEHPTALEFLSHPQFWLHAKNIEALPPLLAADLHCFFHDADAVTLTSRKFLWTYPGKLLTAQSICVLPERAYGDGAIPRCAGVCSDFVTRIKRDR